MSDQAGRMPSATSHPEFDVGFDAGYSSARARVRAVVREWEDYPQSYPRTAFAEDILAALEPCPNTEGNA